MLELLKIKASRVSNNASEEENQETSKKLMWFDRQLTKELRLKTDAYFKGKDGPTRKEVYEVSAQKCRSVIRKANMASLLYLFERFVWLPIFKKRKTLGSSQ